MKTENQIKEIQQNPISFAVKERDKYWNEKVDKLNIDICGIIQYHDQFGDCKGKDCPTCKVLNKVLGLIKETF